MNQPPLYFPEKFPTLETERLLLRETIDSDAAHLFELRSSEQTMRYIDLEPWKEKKEAQERIVDMVKWFKEKEAIQWAISLKGSSEQIGLVCLLRMKKENFRTEIGYMINPTYQRKGIALEAVTKIIDYAFNTMHFHSIEANINPLNTPSIILCEKVGFVKEAHFKENHFFRDTFYDTAIYSKLNPSHQPKY